MKNGKYLDRAAIMREYGFGRVFADAIIARVPKVTVEGVKKVYVERAAVERLIAESKNGTVVRKPLRQEVA